MWKSILPACLSVALLLSAQGSSYGEYSMSLDVPLYGQDTDYYCGAASGQMMMMGYPAAAADRCFSQDNVYQTIQAYKQDNGFYADPDGLKDAVMHLHSPAPPGSYSIFHDSRGDTVMHGILFWMATREYPTAALINRGDHWVVITGFETDVDPRTGNATLLSLDVNDPLPPDAAPHDDPCTAADEGSEGGTVRHVTGTSWFNNDWKNPNRWGTKWLNEYVAVVEPPGVRGKVTAKGEVEEGKPIPPKEALEYALRHVHERKLSRKKPFGFLKESRPSRAFLANRNAKGYYIVPFEYKDGRSPGAVLLNAYTGEFQEIGAFRRPLTYITEREAVRIALCTIGETSIGKPAAAELVFQASEQIKSRYRPAWKVTLLVGKRRIVRYVSQLREVFIELTPQRFGGD